MEKIKFALIGCGNIGSRQLAVIDADPRAQIVDICDIEVDACRKYSELYGGIRYFNDYQEMIEKTNADIISICTPHALHAPMTINVANARKHILVEKPMALTTKDAEMMIETAKQNGVKLMVVKQNRYNIPIILTKNALDGKKLGRIFMVQCNVLWNRHDGYYKESNWRGRKALEGGSLFTQASHFIDLLIWWFRDVINASGTIASKNHVIEIEDCGIANLQFASGVMGSLFWTTCVYNKNYEGSITIIGEHGTIKIGGQYLNKIEFWDVRSLPLPENIQFVDKPNSYGKYQGTSSNHDKVIADVIAVLLKESRNVVEGDEGVKSVSAIEMIYKNSIRIE